jgi:hypothetical protein
MRGHLKKVVLRYSAIAESMPWLGVRREKALSPIITEVYAGVRPVDDVHGAQPVKPASAED